VKLTGDYRFELPREQVWQALLDADVLSRCLPGFERLDEVGENEYEGSLHLRIGPVQGRFQGRLVLSDLDPPHGYRMRMKGQGPAGFIDGSGRLELAEDGSETRLSYDMDAQVGGKIAGLGQRLLDSSARAISEQALAELAKIATTDESSTAAVGDAAEAAAPPSQKQFAAAVAKEVAADLVPRQRRPLAIGIIVAVVIVGVVLLLRTCGG
jgi:carbon monoxide dehydrogenase subunit G